MTRLIKSFLSGNSLVFTCVFTTGHIVIAASVVYIITGATLFESGLVALIEPSINAVWLYILHSLWKRRNGK